MAVHPVEQSDLIVARAIMFAKRKHPNRRRRNSYLNHLFTTWYVVLVCGRVTDPTTVASAVLQRVLKNPRVTPGEVEKRFGTDVRRLVEEVTLDPRLEQATRRALQLKRAPELSEAAKVIRLADTIAGLCTLRVDRTLDENRDDIDWAESVARAVRGVNPGLDATFDEMLDQARGLLDSARRGRWPPATVVAAPARAPKQSKPTKGWDADDPVLKADAKEGVRSLDFAWDDDLTARVQVDGRPEIRLPEVSASILLIVAFFGIRCKDGLSAFLCKELIGVELGRLTGGTYDRHAVDVAIDRLQYQLHKNGVNPLLVEECPERGVRFRLRQCRAQPHRGPAA